MASVSPFPSRWQSSRDDVQRAFHADHPMLSDGADEMLDVTLAYSVTAPSGVREQAK